MIFGIFGSAGSGKDTVAKYMAMRFNTAHIAFADPLKRICRDVYDFSVEQLWGPSEMRNAPDKRYPREHGPWMGGKCACCGLVPTVVVKGTNETVAVVPDGAPQCYLTPRYALQRLGTEWARDCYTDTWSVMGLRAAKSLLHGGYVYNPMKGLVPVDSPSPYQGVVISDVRFKNEMEHIRRAEGLVVRVKRPGDPRTVDTAHASEAEQLEVHDAMCDAVLVNDGTLEELYKKVDLMLEARGWQT